MLQGSLVALVTPMLEDGTIAWEALACLIAHHIAMGSDGLVIAGTTGEASTLSMDEHARLFKEAVAMAEGRIPIIAGTGANATAEAIELSRAAARAGAAAALSVTPYYVKPTQEGLYRHYRAIVEASGLPHILYNVPSRTACDIAPGNRSTAQRGAPGHRHQGSRGRHGADRCLAHSLRPGFPALLG